MCSCSAHSKIRTVDIERIIFKVDRNLIECHFTGLITEHKHFTPERLDKLTSTIYTREYPIPWSRDATPYYPIGDDKNNEVYRMYKEASEQETNVLFGGRLAEYKYYDMHQVVGSALQKSRRELV